MKLIELDDLDLTKNTLLKHALPYFLYFDHAFRFYDLVSRCRKFIVDGRLLYVGFLITANENLYGALKIYIDHDGIDFEKVKEYTKGCENKRFHEYLDVISKIYDDENCDLSDIECSFLPITAAMEIRQIYLDMKKGGAFNE